MKSCVNPVCVVLFTFFQLAAGTGYAEDPVRGDDDYRSSATTLTAAGSGLIRAVPFDKPDPRTFRPFTAVGFGWRGGIGGVGLDVATPLSRSLNLRAGFDCFRYSFAVREEGADITAGLGMGSGHASVDWFPFGGRFRLSPMLVFANNNRFRAKAVIPSGNALSMNGRDYVSSVTDPLHGSAEVSFRKISPGFTLGFGNLIPRARTHVSFPVEVGFYYVDQPRLKVDFEGSACDPDYPTEIGCGRIMDDPGFRRDLAAFIVRNDHNLSYGSFFPVLSFGFGYSF